MNQREHAWIAPEELQLHCDQSLPRKAEFFAAPPEEIGEILSASTTLTTDQEPMSAGPRLLSIIIWGIVGIAIGVVINYFSSISLNSLWYFGWTGGLMSVGLLCGWAFTQFQATCSFVGTEGVAQFTCTGTREQISSQNFFLFRDATELRTTQTRRYTNGVYQGTDYSFVWSDIGGRARHTISGTHNSEQNNPDATDDYHYALAAEFAWSRYLFDQVQREITTKGEARFNLGGRDYVAVGPDWLCLKLGGKTVERNVEDIQSVTIDQGVFKVREVGAKEGWFSTKGVFKFEYAKLANARLFLFVLDKIANIPIE